MTTAPAATAAHDAPTTAAAAPEEDDWLTGAAACSIENGEDCEACQ